MGDEAGEHVARRVIGVVGWKLAAGAGGDKVVDEELMRARVAIGQAGELARQALDRVNG